MNVCVCLQRQYDANDEVMVRERRRLEFPAQKKGSENLSFSLGWDNVQIEAHRKHQGMGKKNKFLMWALSFAVHHRLPSLQLTDDSTTRALYLPPRAFLPQPAEWDERRHRCVILVQRMLVSHVSVFEELTGSITWHVPHPQSKEMAQKTTVVNLGVVEANPASTAGVIDIMTHLHQYVPEFEDGSVHVVPCNGDQLSIERMTHAKRARVQGHSAQDRLQGLLETPQEFHKEGILLQVIIM